MFSISFFCQFFFCISMDKIYTFNNAGISSKLAYHPFKRRSLCVFIHHWTRIGYLVAHCWRVKGALLRWHRVSVLLSEWCEGVWLTFPIFGAFLPFSLSEFWSLSKEVVSLLVNLNRIHAFEEKTRFLSLQNFVKFVPLSYVTEIGSDINTQKCCVSQNSFL